MPLRWEQFVSLYDRDTRHISFIREFASVVSVLQDKTNSLIKTYQDISRLVEELGTCVYTTDAFSTVLDNVQKIVSPVQLSLAPLYQTLTRLALAFSDRPPQSRRVRQPRPVGRRARPADRGHPPRPALAGDRRVVRRVLEDRGVRVKEGRIRSRRRQATRRLRGRQGQSLADTDGGALETIGLTRCHVSRLACRGSCRGCLSRARGPNPEPGHLP